MKKKLITLGLLVGICGVVFASEFESDDDGLSSEFKLSKASLKSEIMDLCEKKKIERSLFLKLVNEPAEVDKARKMLLRAAPLLLKTLPIFSKGVFITKLSESKIKNFSGLFFQESDSLSGDATQVERDKKYLSQQDQVKKTLLLLFLLTKDNPSIKVTIKNSARDVYESLPAEAKELVSYEGDSFYQNHKKKIQFIALCSLAFFLFKYKDLFFKDGLLKTQLFALIEKIISAFKTYTISKMVIASVVLQNAGLYLYQTRFISALMKE